MGTRTLLSLLLVAAAAGSASAQCDGRKLVAAAGDGWDRAGAAVAILAGTAFVGAPGGAIQPGYAGEVRVYERGASGWVEVDVLAPPAGDFNDFFGEALALSGEVLLVGARGDDDLDSDSGAAYVLRRGATAWMHEAKLVASDGDFKDELGTAVGLHRDLAILGAPGDDDSGPQSGSAYVFERVGNSWTEVAKLVAPDGAAGDLFGKAVAVFGDRALVAAPEHDANGPDSGAAYLFEHGPVGWTQVAKLLASDGVAGDRFGSAVALEGGVAVVGADLAHAGTASGAAYVFESATSWVETAKLVAGDAEAGDFLGHSVALDRGRALVGAPGFGQSHAAGKAYLFERVSMGWEFRARLVPGDGQSGDAFGVAIALDGETALVGAAFEDEIGNNAGAGYAFGAPIDIAPYCFCVDSPCGTADVLAGCPSSVGAGARLTGCGTTSVALDDLVLRATGLPTFEPALLFYGSDAGEVPFGDGLLCAAGALRRLPVQDTGSTGAIEYGPGLAAFVQATLPPAAHLEAGRTWHFQAWVRDPAGPCGGGSNTTNAVAVRFRP